MSYVKEIYGMSPYLVDTEQAVVMEQEVQTVQRKEATERV